jgi:hypothetical protein
MLIPTRGRDQILSIIDHPVFKPLPVRVLPVVLLIAWAVFEFLYLGGIVWPILFLAAAGYAGYHLIYRYTPPKA